MSDTVLVTGAAGFIGAAVSRRLLERGETVLGVDCLNHYYDPALKYARLATLEGERRFRFERIDLAEPADTWRVLSEAGATRVVHLAAQAGVRYSLEHPFAYERSNLAGHLSVLEACRHLSGFRHLVYASSSSVYGDRPIGTGGFREDEPAVEPVSLYAATKRAGELLSRSYASLYGFPQTGLRFFTVYGPWGRPDMAYYSFARKIMRGEPIDVFGGGRMARDFTYIDDIVDGIVGALDHPPGRGEHRVLNIGAGAPVALTDMIAALERALGRPAKRIMRPMQPGDVTATRADVSRLSELTGYRPQVMIEEGLHRFAEWFRSYHGDAAQAPPASLAA